MLPDLDPELQTILGTLVRYGRKVILKKWLPDSCIISAAIALDVLEYFGIQAEPFVCTVEVWNPLCRQLLYELGRFPPPEVLEKWREERWLVNRHWVRNQRTRQMGWALGSYC